MASQVEVRGGGDLDGAILQNAATEATLQRLVTIFESRAAGAGGNVRDMFNNLRDNTRSLRESSREIRSSTETTSSFNRALKEAAGGISTLLGQSLQTAVGFLDRGLNAFRDSSAVGAAFNNSIFELAASAAESNLSMEEFTSLIQRNSLVFSNFGGTVTQGAKAFGKLSETFRQELGEQFFSMGLTVRDLNDYLAAYLNLEMRSGRLRGQSERDIRKNAAAYIMELDKTAKLLGVSRKSQEAAMVKAATDPMFRAMQRSLTPEQQARSTSNIAMMDQLSPALTEAMKDAAFFSQTPQGQAIVSAIGRENAQKLLRGDADSQKILVLLAERLDMLQKSYPELASGVGGVVGGIFEVFGYTAPLLKDFGESLETAAAEQEKRDLITTSLAKASDAFNRIKNSLVAAFLRSDTFKNFLIGFEKVSTWISDNADDIIRGLGSFFKPVTDWFSETFEDFMALADQGKYDEAFKTLFPSVFDGIKSILMSAFETISDFLVYLWTGEMPDRLIDKINSAGNAFMKGFNDTGAPPSSSAAANKTFVDKNMTNFKGIKGFLEGFNLNFDGSGFSDIFSFLPNMSINISGMFDTLIEKFEKFKKTLGEQNVGGKSLLDWFTDFKNMFASIPNVLTIAEAKISSVMSQFNKLSENGTIADIRAIVEGLNKLTAWFDSLGPEQINKAKELVAIITPLTDKFSGGGSTDFAGMTATIDALERLINRIDKIDVPKLQTLIDTIRPLMTMVAGGSAIASILPSGNNEITFVEKIDKTIELLGRLENFNVGPVQAMNTEFKNAFDTAEKFIGLKDEAIGFVDGLTSSVDKLTTEIRELKAELPSIPAAVSDVGSKILSYFTSDETPTGAANPSSAPDNNAGMLQWLGNKFDELIGENKEQVRQLKNIAREQ